MAERLVPSSGCEAGEVAVADDAADEDAGDGDGDADDCAGLLLRVGENQHDIMKPSMKSSDLKSLSKAN